MEAIMQTPQELREQSCQYLRIAEKETTLALKRRLTSHALALDYLAEKIEREAVLREDSAA